MNGIKEIVIYLQAFLYYLVLKTGVRISRIKVWHLDLVIFCWRNKISIIEKSETSFIIRLNVLGTPAYFTLRHFPASDFSVFRQVIFPATQYGVTAGFFKNTEAAYRILDGGANVGYTTVYLKCLFPNASVISVEPDADNFKCLQQNVRLNNLSNVNCVNAGLWYESAMLSISNSFRDTLEHSIRVEEAKSPSQLKGFKITDLIREHGWQHLDILKLDIEGAEAEIFKKDTDLLAFMPNIKLVIIEIHDEFDCRDRIMEIFAANNFSITYNAELVYAYNNKAGNSTFAS